MFKKSPVLTIIAVVFGVAFSFLLGVKILKACSNGKWGLWVDTSSCVSSKCGTSEGTKSQKRTCEYGSGSNQCKPGYWVEGVCDKVCPSATFSASHQVLDVPGYYGDCPSGYTVDPHHANKCIKYIEPVYEWRYADKIWSGGWKCPTKDSSYTSTNSSKPCSRWLMISGGYTDEINRPWVDDTYRTETFGPITFQYNKSSDPNHCHRPTGESLGVPSWAMSAFNSQVELEKHVIDGTNCTEDRWVDGDLQTQVVSCTDAPIVACEPEGSCPSYCGYQGGDVVSDGMGGSKVCEAIIACPTEEPTEEPTEQPTERPTEEPTETPTEVPSSEPTATPIETENPTSAPTVTPESGTGGVSESGGNPGAPVCTDAKPNIPYLVSAISLGSNSVKLTWQKVLGSATGYSIFYGPTCGNFIYSVLDTGNVDNFQINGISSGCFEIRALNGCAISDPSNDVTVGIQGAGGSVLGASTMAGTGSFGQEMMALLTLLGLTFTSFGTKKYFSQKSVK